MKLLHQIRFTIPKNKISPFVFDIAQQPGKIATLSQIQSPIGFKIKLMIPIASNINA